MSKFQLPPYIYDTKVKDGTDNECSLYADLINSNKQLILCYTIVENGDLMSLLLKRWVLSLSDLTLTSFNCSSQCLYVLHIGLSAKMKLELTW